MWIELSLSHTHIHTLSPSAVYSVLMFRMLDVIKLIITADTLHSQSKISYYTLLHKHTHTQIYYNCLSYKFEQKPNKIK